VRKVWAKMATEDGRLQYVLERMYVCVCKYGKHLRRLIGMTVYSKHRTKRHKVCLWIYNSCNV